jgi:amino acid transporter
MGAGTYTGIEAVSNGIPILREPKVETAKKTMLYMVLSLAIVVFGLMLSYVFYRVELQAGKTLNAVLAGNLFSRWSFGHWLALITILSEGALLFVAAQTGFIDGPRVMANMAIDSWFPHRFASLSDRLTMHNGILLMGGAALFLLLYTGGHVSTLATLKLLMLELMPNFDEARLKDADGYNYRKIAGTRERSYHSYGSCNQQIHHIHFVFCEVIPSPLVLCPSHCIKIHHHQ